MNAHANFLIDKDRNVNESLELVNKSLGLSPENYELLDGKGRDYINRGNTRRH
jgi:hypothetical protein